MRLGILTMGVVLLLGTAGTGLAAVNCKQVRKYLETGRSVKDVAETMVVSEDDVKKCQEEAPAAPAAGSEKPAAGAEGGQK